MIRQARQAPGTIREVRLVAYEDGTWGVLVCRNSARRTPVTQPLADADDTDPPGSLWEAAQIAAELERAPGGHGVTVDDRRRATLRRAGRSGL